MEYLADLDTLKLSVAELNTLRLRLKLTPNTLSMIPQLKTDNDDAIIDMQTFTNLGSEKQSVFLDLVRSLSLPEVMIEYAETVSDLTYSRSVAAWVSVIPDRWAVMSIIGDDLWLRARTTTEMRQGFTQFLAIYPGLQRNNFRLALTTNAALTALAALDHSLLMSLQSKLAHRKPVSTFSKKELVTRLAEAKMEDFRWPLMFLEKLIPVDLEACLKTTALDLSLKELCQTGLLAQVADDHNLPEDELYLFSDVGGFLQDGFLHETAKLGLKVSRVSDNNDVVHEVFLFLRDPFSLWLMDLAGGEAAIMDLGQADFEQLMESILNKN